MFGSNWKRAMGALVAMAAVIAFSGTASASLVKRFSELVGPVKVGPAQGGGQIPLPFILWGGEAATFHANGNALTTQPGSIFANQGLNFKLTPGDDFVGQVRDYISGKTPYLRGTFHMIAMASGAIGNDPRTQPVVIVQMTWSRGDHLVSRDNVKTVADLRGKKIALQQGGPHVGMLDDALKTAGIRWDEVRVAWTNDITGANGPAELFKRDPSVAAAFAVTPDMVSLTGGLDATGTGAEGTVRGAKVLVSTAHMTRSIADVYAVRKDYFDANRDLVGKFVAGYLKAAEEVVELSPNKRDAKYRATLAFMVAAYKGVLPNETEADGLVADCAFVGHQGNVAFFEDKTNLNGFEQFRTAALDLVTTLGYAERATPFHPAGWNWFEKPFAGYLKHMAETKRATRFKAEAVQADIEALAAGGGMDEKTIYSFTINFDPNQAEFPAAKYQKEYDEAIKLASKYGGAVLAVRGHSDPTMVLATLVKAGVETGALKRTGSPGSYQYSLNGRPLNIGSPQEVARAVESGAFDHSRNYSPREVLQAARTLSLDRANAVRNSVLEYATRQKRTVDPSQIQPQGVGIAEPFIATPRSEQDAAKNRRVEFALIRVSAEAAAPDAFDY